MRRWEGLIEGLAVERANRLAPLRPAPEPDQLRVLMKEIGDAAIRRPDAREVALDDLRGASIPRFGGAHAPDRLRSGAGAP